MTLRRLNAPDGLPRFSIKITMWAAAPSPGVVLVRSNSRPLTVGADARLHPVGAAMEMPGAISIVVCAPAMPARQTPQTRRPEIRRDVIAPPPHRRPV